MGAVNNNSKDTVKLLFEYGADKTVKDLDGKIALVFCFVKNSYEIIELLK